MRLKAVLTKFGAPGRLHNVRPVVSSRQARALSSTAGGDDEVAIIGGGITGLVTAYRLATSTERPLRITLYEGSKRLGGWLNTKFVNVEDGTVVFERGPRALRTQGPSAEVTKQLVQMLQLEGEVVTTSKTSSAARNRYIYGPDHLMRLPGSSDSIPSILRTIWNEPFLKGLFPGLLSEYFKPRRSSDLDDESVGSFISRRISPHLANNVASAVLHGIYAGDIYQLSVKSLAKTLWDYEAVWGSITKALLVLGPGYYSLSTPREYEAHMIDYESERLPSPIWQDAVQYSFRNGIQTLVQTLENALRRSPHVRLETERDITRITYDESTKMVNIFSPSHVRAFSQAVSTVSCRSLARLIQPIAPSLANVHSVSVMVVNLYYTNVNLLSVHGFGYLIPRSIPYDLNPERALGVVFDSDAVMGLGTAPGTKLTVMIGGHWWDGRSTYPDEEEGASMATSVLRRHLNIHEAPTLVHVSVQRDCIPQYTVGHHRRMHRAHEALLGAFKGQLKVAGNSYTGVGVNDCIKAGTEVAASMVEGIHGTETGLDRFADEERFLLYPRTHRRSK